MIDQQEMRLLSEIAHKLEYAIRTAENPPPAPEGGGKGGGLDPAALGAFGALLKAATLDELHQRALELAIAVTGAERGFLMLIEEGRKLRFKCGVQMDQQTIQKEADYSRTIIKQVVQTGEPVLIGDTSQAADTTSSSIKGLRMRSIMCAPLVFAGQVGGIVYLDARSLIRAFDRQSLEVLLGAAALAVSAIESFGSRGAPPPPPAPAVDANAAKVQENFARLLDVGRTVSSTLVLEELLELVIEKVLEVTRADRGFLMLLEAGKTEPVFRIGLTWNKKDGPARRKRKLDETQFFFSRTVCRKALETKQSVVLQDAQAGGGEDASVSIMQMDLHSVMVTPLVEKGQVLGLIYVDSKMSNRSFADSDLELFEALAGQAAIGLKNAMLYSQVATQQRIESEIAIASNMQKELCPETTPKIQAIELTGYMEPAREVGGDYYDYVEDSEAPGQKLSIVVGDVSGKGLGAGIVAVMARCFLRSMIGAYGMDSPSTLLGYLNHTLCGELKPGKFMTMLLMVWDAARSTVTYAASGHENIIVWRAATRQAETITSGGSPLGISRTTGGPTPDTQLVLQPGDTVVTYTDGVTEAMDKDSNEYTLERLVALINRVGGQHPDQIKETLLADLAAHRGEAEVSDDITLVIFRRV